MSSPDRRGLWRVGGVLLLACFCLLRLLAARNHSVDLIEPEEFLNLRLARQLAADLPVGPLGDYWYTGVGGPTGAGTLVLSLLYVPITWLVGSDVGALRLMGGLWALAGALLTAGIAREIFGRPGLLAGLAAALAMPPAWLGFTLMSRGNYVEAAVLSLLGIYLLLLAVRVEPGRRLLATTAALGGTLGFAVWFWPSAWPLSILTGAAALVLLGRRDARLLVALSLGLGLSLLLPLSGLGPTDHPPDPISSEARRDVATSLLSSPGSWPSFVHGSLASLPLLEPWSPDLEGTSATDEGPEWAASWLGSTRHLWRAANWLVLILVSSLLILRGEGAGRAVGAILGLAGLGVPLALGLLGVGANYLPVEQLYFFDARRAAIVYPLWAIAWAGVFSYGWTREGPQRIPARVLVVGLFALGAVAAASYALAGAGRPADFQPGAYMLCPEDQPKQEVAVCIGLLRDDQVPLLEELAREERLAQPSAKRALLQGFGAVEVEDRPCTLAGGSPLLDATAASGLDTGLAALAWEGVGLALGLSCTEDGGRKACEQSNDAQALQSCLSGVARGREARR